MTPEQLRMITDAMASAGAAIGGSGSVGDLVGRTVIAQNRRSDVAAKTRENEIARETRAADRGKEWMNAMNQFAGMSQNIPASEGAKYLKSMAQFPGQVDSGESILTHPDKAGMTSMSMGKDGQVTTTFRPESGLSPEQYKSAMTAAQGLKSSEVSNEYTKVLTEQARNALKTGKPTEVVIDGQTFTLTQAKAADYARGKYGDITAGEQSARVKAAELVGAPGGGVVTAKALGAFNLGETGKTTEIKSAEYGLKHPEVGAEMKARKRAGAVNLGEFRDKRAAGKQVDLEASLRNPEYTRKLKAQIEKTDAGMRAMSELKHSDPAVRAKGQKTLDDELNRAMFSDYKTTYGIKGSKVVIRTYDGVPWIVQKTPDGEIVKLRELTGGR